MLSVVITGASRGIGHAIAKRFSAAGFEVYGTCTSTQSIPNSNFVSDFFVSDFTTSGGILSCSKWISNLKPDILINNAGINKITPFLDLSYSDFLEIQSVNLHAPLLLCKAVLPHMISNSFGRILNISSIWGLIGKEFRTSYSVSKFGLDGLTLSLSAEFSSLNILSNCLSPGFTDTDLTQSILGSDGISNLAKSIPIRRLAQPDEIAEFAFWLASPINTYVTGQNFAIDGGFSRV